MDWSHDSRDELLEHLSDYAIAPLFNKVVQELVDSSSSSSSDSDSDDETNMILGIMDFVDSTRDIDLDQPLDESGALLEFCLRLYKPTFSQSSFGNTLEWTPKPLIF